VALAPEASRGAVSENGGLRHGEKILGWGRPPSEGAKVAYALTWSLDKPDAPASLSRHGKRNGGSGPPDSLMSMTLSTALRGPTRGNEAYGKPRPPPMNSRALVS